MSVESAEAPTDAPKPTRRRRLGLSVRALMLVVLVLGGWLGWIARRARVQRGAVAVLRRHHAGVWFNQTWHQNPYPADPQPGPPMLRRWLGPDYFDTALSVRLYGRGIPQTTSGDEVMRAACQLPWLERLSIVGCDATDAGAEGLGGLSRLKSLDLRMNPRMTPQVVKSLGRLTNIEWISLGAIPLRDGDMDFLRRLPKLQYLGIFGHGSTLTDSFLDQVPDRANFTALQLYDVPITAGGLGRLRGSANLETLTLDGTNVDRLDVLRSFPKLRVVGLVRNPIDDDDLAALGTLPQLKTLDLSNTKITDRGIEVLATLPALSQLWLEGTEITDASLVAFAKIPKLVSVSIRGTRITRGAIAAFQAAHPSIEINP